MSALIDRIQASAVHDGDCWRWIGARQSRGQTPCMTWNGKVGNVRRFILLERGVPMKGLLAWTSCGNQHCVNPAHAVPATRAVVSTASHAAMDEAARALRAMRTAHAVRARGVKLSMEIADAIRDDERPQRTIAAEYGISQHTVQSIKAGLMWRKYTAASNPFTQLMR